MTRVSLVTDSACYIPAGLLDRYGIQAVPLNIQIGDQGYEEPELEPDDFYSRLAEGARATTSQPAPGQFIAAYQRAVADGPKPFSRYMSAVICPALSSQPGLPRTQSMCP